MTIGGTTNHPAENSTHLPKLKGQWRQKKNWSSQPKGRITQDPNIDFEKTQETAKRAFEVKLTGLQERLDQSNKEVESLQAQVKHLKELIGLSDIQKPNVHDLRLNVMQSGQLICEIKKFKEEIIKFENDVSPLANAVQLDDLKNFDELDADFDHLIENYRTLAPQVADGLSQLTEVVLKASYKAIPEDLHNVISAKFLVSMEQMKANDAKFNEAFEACKLNSKNIETELQGVKTALYQVKTHLNAIDHKIYCLKNPSAWGLVYCGEKTRLSPMDKGFLLEKPKVEEIAVIETPVVQTV